MLLAKAARSTIPARCDRSDRANVSSLSKILQGGVRDNLFQFSFPERPLSRAGEAKYMGKNTVKTMDAQAQNLEVR
jgi:hypothetical protein